MGDRAMFPMRERILLESSAKFTDCPVEDVFATAKILLGWSGQVAQGQAFASRLNNDGSPLQVCLSFSQTGYALRILADPRSDLSNALERHRCALEVLDSVLSLSACSGLDSLVTSTLKLNLPPDIEAHPRLSHGTLWIGVPIGEEGLALYLNGAWGSYSDQWDRVEHWLDALAYPDRSLTEVLSRLRYYGALASVGLEGVDPSRTRLKVYFRLRELCNITDLGIDLLCSGAVASFLSAALGAHGIAASGLVFSLGVNPTKGAIIDAKIDLCGHCLRSMHIGWQSYLETCVRAVGLPLFDASALALDQGVEVAFLGFGVGKGRSPRLNLYLKGCE